jgi:uncharacterized membrane protein YdjX (TVP38/TMEM64 family)
MDTEALAGRVRAVGPLGVAVIIAILVLQCVVAPIPSEPVMLAAGLVYGRGTGFALAWLGVVGGAAACFGLARVFGRPVAERFVRVAHLDALDAFVEKRGVESTFALVLALRLFAFTSFDVVSYGCGLTRFPFRWFLLATALGVVPKALAFTYAGATVAERPGWLDALIVAGMFGALFLAPWLVRHHRRATKTADEPSRAGSAR